MRVVCEDKRAPEGTPVDHDYVFVDSPAQEDLEDAIRRLKNSIPDGSFPTLVINDGTHVIIGFKEQEIGEALG